MSDVRLRVKYAGGQSLVKGLDQTDSLEKLISNALEALGIKDATETISRLMAGFPPKAVDISDRDKSISDVGIRSGDTIQLIFQSTGESKRQEDRSEGRNKRLKINTTCKTSLATSLQRKVIPADNSCLFTAINYCMTGSLVSSEHSAFMREVIASVVSGDKEKYSKAYLGRENSQYCTWILTKQAWGGAIEVQILAEYFQVQILVVDTKSGCLTVFGESREFSHQMALIYDGIHYDALYDIAVDGKEVTLHSAEDKRCLVCGIRLKGEKEAQQHATNTRHKNFSEV